MDLNEKKEAIIKFMASKKTTYCPIKDESIDKIYNLLFFELPFDPSNAEEYHYIGISHLIKNNHNEMIKYLEKAVALNNIYSMHTLGYYFQFTQEDEVKMTKYYFMAIDRKCNSSMNNLANFYMTKKDHELAIKYYKMAIEHENSAAMYNLGAYYQKVEPSTISMLIYYRMAAEYGFISAMNSLGHYYKSIKNYEEMLKYHIMASEKGDNYSLHELRQYYTKQNRHDKILILSDKYNYEIDRKSTIFYFINQHHVEMTEELTDAIININIDDIYDEISIAFKLLKQFLEQHNELIENHCKYAINGEGYEAAKKDFISIVNNMI